MINNNNDNSIKNKLSTSRLIIFNSISNICFISVVGFSLLVNIYGNMSWLVLLGLILITILFSFFYKGLPKNFDALKFVKNNYVIRICIIVYLIIVIVLVNLISALVIKKYFYTENSIMTITIVSLIVATIISQNKMKNIIDISMLFFILIPILYILTLFTMEDRYIKYFFPINLDIKNLNYALIILIFPMENTLMFLFNNQTKEGIKRKHFLITNICTLLYLLFIIIDSFSLLSANFLKDLRYSSFYRWHLFSGNKFIQNFDIFLLIIIIITVLFRLGYYFQIFRLALMAPQKKKLNIIFLVFFFLLTYILYLNVNNIFNIVNKLLYFMFFIILLIFLGFVKKSMEVKNE